jgi:uncharacterized membrane protein YgdD (TMEM256/DUF423 family)
MKMHKEQTLSSFSRFLFTSGAVLLATGIILGAFAAHGLKSIVTEYQLDIIDTGVKYQLVHGLAIILLALIQHFFPLRLLRNAALIMLTGIVLFSSSLYILALRDVLGLVDVGGIGIVTPIGGVLMIIGWLCFIGAVLKIPSDSSSNDNKQCIKDKCK